MNYKNIAKQILKFVGDSKNVEQATHCLTRLRIAIKNPELVRQQDIESIDGVKKMIVRGNNLQIIIGEDVDDVYEEFLKIYSAEEYNKNDLSEEIEEGMDSKKKPNVFLRIIDVISGCIAPILPALIACGLCSGLVALITAFGWVDAKSTTYAVLNTFGTAPLYFLPFLLAYSSSKRLNVNTAVSMGIAAIMLLPSLTTLLSGDEAVTFFGIGVKNVKYSQNLIPILLVVWVQSIIEPKLNRIIPKYLKTLFLPFIEYVVLGLLCLLIIGPVAGYINDALYALFSTLSDSYAWIVVSILGCTNALRIGAGLNHSILPIAVANFSALGYDNIVGPAMFCTVFSLAGTCIGLALKTRNQELRQTALSAAFTAMMGISEPAVFSVMLVNLKSMIATSIAGLCGGLFMGIMNVSVNALGTKGLPGMALLIGPSFVSGIIGCVISFGIGVALAYILGDNSKHKVMTKQK